MALGQLQLELHARVAERNFRARLRVLQECEPSPCDRLHIRIDFVEAERIARTAIRRQRADAEPYQPDSPVRLPHPIQRTRCAAVRPIVCGGPGTFTLVEILKSVQNGPMPELP